MSVRPSNPRRNDVSTHVHSHALVSGSASARWVLGAQAHCSGSVRLAAGDASSAEVLKLTNVPADLLLEILALVNAQPVLEGRVMPRMISHHRPELPTASVVIHV